MEAIEWKVINQDAEAKGANNPESNYGSSFMGRTTQCNLPEKQLRKFI